MKSSLIRIGSVSSTHGLTGAFKAALRLEDESLEKLKQIYIGQDKRFAFKASVEGFQKLGHHEALVQIHNFTHLDHASAFLHSPMWCDKNFFEKTSDIQLLDKQVLDEKSNLLGIIDSISCADVRKFVHITRENKTLNVPLQPAYFRDIDLKADSITFHDYHLFKDLWV